MKRKIEIAERIKEVRAALGMTGVQFARHGGFSQSKVSEWEAGKYPPSAEMFVRLGNVAPLHLRLWFWKQAGLRQDALNGICGQIAAEQGAPPAEGEIVRIPEFRETLQGREEAGPPIPLPARFIPHPERTVCLSVDKRSTAVADSPKGIFIVDTFCEGAEDLSALWSRVVILRYAPEGDDPLLEHGIFSGRLWMKDYAYNPRQPELAGVTGELVLLTRVEVVGMLYLGSYAEPEGMRGIGYEDGDGRSSRMAEIHKRALSAFRARKGIRILGKVIGRLTGHLDIEGAEK